MGCGKQASSRQSVEIVVISSAYERSQHLSAHLAAPLAIQQEIPSIDPQVSQEYLKVEKPERLLVKKETINDVSKISKIDEDPLKHFTIKFRSPTEVALKNEGKSVDQGFNFDFLNESSNYNSNVQGIIDDVLRNFRETNWK